MKNGAAANSEDAATRPARRMRELLKAEGIIVSPGVYDGYSVKLVEAMGFSTACTTGAGIANSRLGVPDIGIMGLTDNLETCRMIARSVSIPIMADADTGYGNPSTAYYVTQRFEEAGVAGINLEDQVSPKRCGHMIGKEVVDKREMARKVEAACAARKDDDFVILARTDAIAVEGIESAIDRARLYASAGADLVFADAIGDADQIRQFVESVPVPVSVNMGFGIRRRPTTPLLSIPELEALGVKRVTLPRMLPAAALKAMENAILVLRESMETGVVVDRPDLLAGIDDIWALMGQPEAKRLQDFYDVFGDGEPEPPA